MYAAVAELVVATALLGIGENFVGLGALLEPEFRLGLVGAVVAVRVILHRQPPIRALDLLVIRRASDAEDLVIVALRGSHTYSPQRRRVHREKINFALPLRPLRPC